MDEATRNESRVCAIHTIHHESIRAVVREIISGHCRSTIPYEVREDGTFCLNKKHMFTRKLLENWILDIRGSEGTFRDAFFSWVAMSSTTTAEFHIIESAPSVNRQTGNEAFCRFLMLLRFPNSSDFTELFACNESTNRDLPGKGRMNAVVMYGTALGILGKLLSFEWKSSIFPAVSRIPRHQYIMRTPKNHAFVDGICLSARKNVMESKFNPALHRKFNSIKVGLYKTFFQEDLSSGQEEYYVSKFLRCCYTVSTMTESGNIGADDDEYEEHNNQKRLYFLSHNFDDIELRRSITNFGRCFLSGSIAGAAVRNKNSSKHASILQSHLLKLAGCGSMTDNSVWSECTSQLLFAAKEFRESIHSAALISNSIAESAIVARSKNLRGLVGEVALILKSAVSVRNKFVEAYDKEKFDGAAQYEHDHRHGSNNMEGVLEDFLLEAQRTGELFPGRPEVRPRVDFGSTSKDENTRSCHKHYVASNS